MREVEPHIATPLRARTARRRTALEQPVVTEVASVAEGPQHEGIGAGVVLPLPGVNGRPCRGGSARLRFLHTLDARRSSTNRSRSSAARSNSRCRAAQRLPSPRPWQAGAPRRRQSGRLLECGGAKRTAVRDRFHLIHRLDDRQRGNVVLDVVGDLDRAAAVGFGDARSIASDVRSAYMTTWPKRCAQPVQPSESRSDSRAGSPPCQRRGCR